MSNNKNLESLKYDSRLLEYNLRRGTLTKEELKKHLDQLPDLSDKCEKLELDDSSVDQASSQIQQH